MADYVEARSLSALNQLAANPPLYPKKPTETKQDALALYISRVPGTRDVILSTLKPQVKNVTAEDVASSLYYLHFQSPDEDPLPPPNQPLRSPSPRSSEESPRSQIHRKPLPGMPDQPSTTEDHLHASAAAPSGKENQGLKVAIRKPVPPAHSNMAELRQIPDGTGPPPPVPIHRKPLGSRPIQADPAGVGLTSRPLDGSLPYPLSHESRSTEQRPPPLPDRPPAVPLRPLAISTVDPAVLPVSADGNAPSSTCPKRRPFTPFSLTLIRRDPSTGQQWNVGRIASFQLENPELIDEGKHPQPSPSVQIHLESSGYAKFRGMPTDADMGALRGSLDILPGSASSLKRPQFPDMSRNMPTSGSFERQVKMTYSQSFTANIRQRFRSKSSAGEGRSTSPIRRPGHDRHGSQASIGSFGGDFDGSEAPVITQPAPGLKPRGYMFFSPWNGRCEFVTGSAGRSLRCRHVLPSYNSGVFNPLAQGSDPEHGEERSEKAEAISELRFNLPTNELFSDKKVAEGGVRTRDHLQSQFHKMVARAQGLEDSDDGEFYFDMSLGREKAGGGNRGKRAKMGKLIIFDEGLKMLDLAVAANVGIWWITWERTYDG